MSGPREPLSLSRDEEGSEPVVGPVWVPRDELAGGGGLLPSTSMLREK